MFDILLFFKLNLGPWAHWAWAHLPIGPGPTDGGGEPGPSPHPIAPRDQISRSGTSPHSDLDAALPIQDHLHSVAHNPVAAALL